MKKLQGLSAEALAKTGLAYTPKKWCSLDYAEWRQFRFSCISIPPTKKWDYPAHLIRASEQF
jgi:hypothetical protein